MKLTFFETYVKTTPETLQERKNLGLCSGEDSMCEVRMPTDDELRRALWDIPIHRNSNCGGDDHD